MALTTRLSLKLIADQTNPVDLGTPSFPLALSFLDTLASGTAADQADILWTDERTLTTGATEDLDFTGSLTNVFGVTVALAKVKLVLFMMGTANTTRVTISRPAANGLLLLGAASDALASFGAGALVLMYDPGTNGICAVTGGTGDLLTITNAAGASATYKVAVIGTSV